jgi:hypothetical protein
MGSQLPITTRAASAGDLTRRSVPNTSLDAFRLENPDELPVQRRKSCSTHVPEAHPWRLLEESRNSVNVDEQSVNSSLWRYVNHHAQNC